MGNRSNKRDDLIKVFNLRENINIENELKKDFQARTLKGSSKKALDKVLHELIDNIKEYIKNKEKGVFKEWHNKTCEWFLEEFKKADGSNEIKYGKAQKMVNMAFKYLYCTLNDEKLKSFNFEQCHMTLDSYTLNWFYDNVLEWYNKTSNNSQVLRNKFPKWSNLTYNDGRPYTYLWIQTQIKEYFNAKKEDKNFEYNGLTPFEAEFYIWQEEKEKSVIKELESTLKKFENTKFSKIDNQLKKHLIDGLQEVINDIQIKNKL